MGEKAPQIQKKKTKEKMKEFLGSSSATSGKKKCCFMAAL
jgi:hypothetical protein